ncbi:phage major capsid protein [Caballeronia arationis]|uniref:phage major capsid protein n=1 Tax=Caballeronia arationis TaxID=1777142 RepID=UPI000BE3B4F1|nr:phage major capsid protein [Caballeronia arationis]
MLVSQNGDAVNGVPLVPQQVLPGLAMPPRFYEALRGFNTGAGLIQVLDTVATGTAGKQVEGQTKAEITNRMTPRNIPVETVAAFKRISNQLLEDSGGIGPYLESELQGLVRDAVDAYVVETLTDAGTVYTPAAGSGPYDTLVLALATPYGLGGLSGGAAIGLNPQDWAGLLLLKDDAGNYQTAPFTAAPTSLAGATLAVSNAIPLGSFLLASTPAGAVLANRTGMRVDLSSEEGQNFVTNATTSAARRGWPQSCRTPGWC